jgi:hypothetical protein
MDKRFQALIGSPCIGCKTECTPQSCLALSEYVTGSELVEIDTRLRSLK